jgi:hypothetical protein
LHKIGSFFFSLVRLLVHLNGITEGFCTVAKGLCSDAEGFCGDVKDLCNGAEGFCNDAEDLCNAAKGFCNGAEGLCNRAKPWSIGGAGQSPADMVNRMGNKAGKTRRAN